MKTTDEKLIHPENGRKNSSSDKISLEAPVDEKTLAGILEALLFCCDEPLTAAKLVETVPEFQDKDIKKIVDNLNLAFRKTGRTFQIDMVAGGYQMFTLPQFSPVIEKLFAKRQLNRLSAKALETLAIIAYKQPVTRTEIEEIRGVNADGVLKTLLTRNLVTISGTANTPGNPFLYKTTKSFLGYFGLKSLKVLPKLKELDEIIEADSEVQEKFGEEFFKEISSDKLGIHSHGKAENSEHEKPKEP